MWCAASRTQPVSLTGRSARLKTVENLASDIFGYIV
jgi:hypothetical protein